MQGSSSGTKVGKERKGRVRLEGKVAVKGEKGELKN